MSTRRRFILGAGSALALAARQARAQPAPQKDRVHRIGYLAVRSRSTTEKPDIYYDAFVHGMRELGYVEGRNLHIEWRFADGNYAALVPLAAELVRANVEVLVTHATPPAKALQKATTTVPIVFTSVGNPVEVGLVRNLSRPEGNTTGVANMTNEVVPKQIQWLRTVLPKLSRAGVMYNPENNTTLSILESAKAVGAQLGIQIQPLPVRRAEDLDETFSASMTGRNEALIVAADALFIALRREIVVRCAKARLAAIYAFAEDVQAGGLMSYGPNNADVYRRGAIYVDKILKGAKPSELPVEQPTQFELVLNEKVAATLGISFSESLLLRAAQVIR
jgi:putative ABC transport system substrate-binding protein